jgi:uncharacterized DUF497 family protein
MNRQFAGFDWDRGNRDKCQKHGVTLAEIEEIFTGPVSIYPDPDHSKAESRFLGIGQLPGNGRYIFAAFTIRQRDGKSYLRPISARYMHRREIEHYEKRHY